MKILRPQRPLALHLGAHQATKLFELLLGDPAGHYMPSTRSQLAPAVARQQTINGGLGNDVTDSGLVSSAHRTGFDHSTLRCWYSKVCQQRLLLRHAQVRMRTTGPPRTEQ